MRLVLWLVLIGTLLGVVGYLYFDHWYGWLTSLGALAIRVGPMFLWRTILRVVRKQFIGLVFRFLPSLLKRWVRERATYLRKTIRETLSRVLSAWKSSWLIRMGIILPLIVLCVVLAHDTEGIAEFLFLFPIPFLFTALFPEGFWAVVLVLGLNVLASHGLEQVAFWIASKVPWGFLNRYRAVRDDIQRTLAEKSRPIRTRIRKSLRLLRRAEHAR